MNKVMLTGNLVKDIELKNTNDGNTVTSNTIAVKRDRKNADGEYEVDFINCVVWGNQAQYLKDYAKKGDHLELVGHWVVRKYEDAQGNMRTINEVVVESLSLYSNKPRETQSEPTTYEDARKELKNDFDKNDLPF